MPSMKGSLLTIVVATLSWWSCGVLINNLGKVLLTLFPFPVSVSFSQMLPGALVVIAQHWFVSTRADASAPFATAGHSRWMAGYQSASTMRAQWRWGVLLGLCCIGGQVLHRIAMLHVSIPLIQVLKSCGPFFSAFLGFIWTKERLPSFAYISLVPLVGGVLLSAQGQLHARVHTAGTSSLLGLMCSLASCLCLAISGVGSKRLMNTQANVDSSTVWLCMNFWSSVLISPLLLHECPRILEFVQHAQPASLWYVLALLVGDALLVSVSFRLSMTILEQLSPTTHSVLTLCKRIVVIVGASLYFGTHLPLQTNVGIGISALGTICYAQALSKQDKLET